MQRDERETERYGDDVQNTGLNAREYEGTHMICADRRLFGLDDARLRGREQLMQLRDENEFPEDEN